mgnify:CR=1 FL=1
MNKLQPGSKAPAFKLTNQHDEVVQLKDFIGKKVVIFFYPKDNTPTCTIEACSLRNDYNTLQAKGMEVIGISPDDAKSHQKFIANFKLPFTLLSDPSKKVLEAYEVWGQKKLFGIEYMGVKRTTFLIDEKGKIAHIITAEKSNSHAQQFLSLWR